MFLLEEEEHYFISITKNIRSYERAFYKYVTDNVTDVTIGY